ncbi:hypothetical protein G3T14_00540 [Methylobacterium sp. BTF04]|uniref:hypothetical protein n=1 Tax=Methylobacterium sp. BTF04 TaxID=2708300 RepID=UPI0013D3CDA2|nr:hypothetical protein [Methylobacterium sp. BTF04]NEU10615.1 hypothetical protein [Methylobacterium sp. BTF04]
MTRHAWLAAGLLAAFTVPALASPCADRLTKVESLAKDKSKNAISASTGGQAGAGARGGQGVTGNSGAGSAEAAAPSEKSAEAGKGGDLAIQAKVALDEARTADGKGDETACMEALGRAQKLLATAP